MALYPATETNTFNMAHAVYMCGNSYKADSNGGLCPNTGSVTFKNKFPKAGHYKVSFPKPTDTNFSISIISPHPHT